MAIPNQKRVYIERSSESIKKDFFKVSNTNLRLAMFNLSPSTFKLWCYFADNANGYVMDLYAVDFCSTAGVSYSTYQRSFKELVEKGYIIKSDKAKNTYLFREESPLAMSPDAIISVNTEDLEAIKERLF